jgi:hypothetical protein
MTAVPQRCIEDALADRAAAIRECNKRVIEDIVEIGRHLTEAKAAVGHGNFCRWIVQEFGWTDRTARNYMHVCEMALNWKCVSDLKVPLRELYLLASPSTPEEARAEIFDRAAAGEQVSGKVLEAIDRAQREKGTAEAETAQVTPSDTGEAPSAEQEPEADLAPTEPAPDPAATAAAAVNTLIPTELQNFLDLLWPAHKRAFELKFGARNSDTTNAEIAALASECSALLTNVNKQNTDAIHKKLARIKTLAGGSKARASNAQLDRGAFSRVIGTAGQPGEKFPTINAAKDSADGIWK